ncbi:hypothetical protein [Lelliottia amnigena]|uniref:hypothetical protein n=1 Tax=Lelliottia amnigena TaxID=61646 RepID=UPI001EF80417|nr:hypothetical protein [Lelliottia amnigena]MCG7780630.1 hypothetical protein [Lelliottia amnigena]
MKELFNISINKHCLKENDITIDDCLNELYKSASLVKEITRQEQTWYLTGHSKKEALKYKVFNGNEPNQTIIDIFERHYKKITL